MPNTAVKWRAALLGTLVAATLFQLARLAFGRYFELVSKNYSNIYSALAMLIILAIWTYAAWGDYFAWCGGFACVSALSPAPEATT